MIVNNFKPKQGKLFRKTEKKNQDLNLRDFSIHTVLCSQTESKPTMSNLNNKD